MNFQVTWDTLLAAFVGGASVQALHDAKRWIKIRRFERKMRFCNHG